MHNTWESFKYVMTRTVVVPLSIGLTVAVVGGGVIKWWRKKI